MANLKPDHRPVKVEATFTSYASKPVERRRTAKYDRNAVHDAITSTDPRVREKVQLMENHLNAMPVIPLVIEESSHRQIIADYYLEGLAAIFPAGQTRKRTECMSPETFGIVCERGQVRHALNLTAVKLAQSMVICCFLFIRGACIRRYRRPWWGCVHGPKTKRMCFKQKRLQDRVDVLKQLIRDGCTQDILRWSLARSKELEEASLESNKRSMFRIIRGMKAWQPFRDFRIAGKDGKPSTTDFDERVAIKEGFQEKLAAVD